MESSSTAPSIAAMRLPKSWVMPPIIVASVSSRWLWIRASWALRSSEMSCRAPRQRSSDQARIQRVHSHRSSACWMRQSKSTRLPFRARAKEDEKWERSSGWTLVLRKPGVDFRTPGS